MRRVRSLISMGLEPSCPPRPSRVAVSVLMSSRPHAVRRLLRSCSGAGLSACRGCGPPLARPARRRRHEPHALLKHCPGNMACSGGGRKLGVPRHVAVHRAHASHRFATCIACNCGRARGRHDRVPCSSVGPCRLGPRRPGRHGAPRWAVAVPNAGWVVAWRRQVLRRRRIRRGVVRHAVHDAGTRPGGLGRVGIWGSLVGHRAGGHRAKLRRLHARDRAVGVMPRRMPVGTGVKRVACLIMLPVGVVVVLRRSRAPRHRFGAPPVCDKPSRLGCSRLGWLAGNVAGVSGGGGGDSLGGLPVAAAASTTVRTGFGRHSTAPLPRGCSGECG